MEFDLIVLGLRLSWLGTGRLSWRDLLVVIRQQPVTSAMSRTVLGDAVAWSTADHLLAQLVDNANWLVWSKTEDGSKNKNRPSRLLRPGDKPDEDDMQHGSDPLSLEDMQAWLGWQTPSHELPQEAQPRDALGRFVSRSKEAT